MTSFSLENVSDGCRVVTDAIKIISVNHYDSQIRVAHDFVGVASRFRPYSPCTNDDNNVTLEKMSKSDFLGHIIKGYVGGILALYLPARKHQSRRLENKIDFSTTGRLSS